MAQPDPNNSQGQIRASVRDVLVALRKHLIQATALDPAAVMVVRRRDKPVLVAEQSVRIWVRGEKPDRFAPRSVEGGGRANDMRQRQVTLLVSSRTKLDATDRDGTKLLDAALGAIQLEDRVFDAVELFSTTNPAGQLLTSHPATAGVIGDPAPDAANPDFTTTPVELELYYARNVSQSIQ